MSSVVELILEIRILVTVQKKKLDVDVFDFFFHGKSPLFFCFIKSSWC
jgi:hypothetical protein